MKRIVPCLAVASLLSGSAVTAAEKPDAPVLVELFTSQGCSSCPPADDVLAQLASRSNVVALSFHVDYWDYIGWKDPFASPLYTARQRNYRAAFGNRAVYTPQMVVNGAVEMPGQRLSQAERAMAAARADSVRAPVMTASSDGRGRVRITVDGSDASFRAVVWAAAFDPKHVTPVRRGENGGRTLVNVNTVRKLERVGSYTGAALDASFTAPAPDMGVAVWLQEEDYGRVLNAVTAAAVAPMDWR